ncbi:hypothetical protein ACOMHN_035448 [Nucella lapillus]
MCHKCFFLFQQLGVNGYAFAVTNHGYILFHPDFRPFYKPDGQPNKNPELQLRPKYNSVDLSEVELPYDQGVSREHPLRKYLLTAREGGQNTTQTVLTHFDDLKRVKLQKNRYQFIAVADTFRLVFVLPDNYGDKVLAVDPFAMPDLAKAFNDVGAKASDSRSAIAPWIYCTDKNGHHVRMDERVLHEFVQWNPTVKYECDKSLVRHLLLDAKETLTYDDVWNGSSFNPGEGDGPVKEECISRSSPDNPEAPCIRGMYPKYGIDFVWIGTASGFTRYQYFFNPAHGVPSIIKPDLPHQYTSSIQSLYYQRAIYGWDEGLDYIFYMEKDIVSDGVYVVMTTAEVVGRRSKTPAPVAVSALRMDHHSFQDIFFTETEDCPGKHHCEVTCRDKDILNCYLIDNNGYIMATNVNQTATSGPRDRATPPVVSGTRLYREVVQSLPSPTHHAQSNPRHTQHDVRQHEQTVTETARDISAAKWRCEEDPNHVSYQSAENDDIVADQRSNGSSHHTDHQTDDDKTGSDNAGLCYTEEGCAAVTNRDSEMTTTLAIEEPEVMSGAVTGCEEVIAAPQTPASGTDTETKTTQETKDGNKGKKTEADENRYYEECGGSTEYPQNVKYFLCNYVVFEHSNQAFNEHITVNNHACVQTASRFALNTTTVKAKKRFNGSLTDCGQCSATHKVSYTVIWLEKTNLILIMAAADCDCSTNTTTFHSTWDELQYILDSEEQCERLYRFSTELKRVDNTRTKDALCLDSRDEEDYTCGQSGLLSLSPPILIAFSLLTCVFVSHLLER